MISLIVGFSCPKALYLKLYFFMLKQLGKDNKKSTRANTSSLSIVAINFGPGVLIGRQKGVLRETNGTGINRFGVY